MLPLEDEVRQEITETFRDDLVACYDLLQLGLDLLGLDAAGNLSIPSTPIPDVGDNARSLALGLYAKACKQFRGIILLGERGFGGEVTVLTRSLFETTLALEFVIKETITLKQNGNVVDIDPTKPLTTDFRAQLYAAYPANDAERRLDSLTRDPAVPPEAIEALGDPTTIKAEAAMAKNAIGQAWWDRQKAVRNYAGLQVRHLADSLGVIAYYIMVYGQQSEVVHGGDALAHIEVSDDQSYCLVALAPSAEGIGPRLYLAALVFLGCASSLHNRLGFGVEVESRIKAFACRLGVPAAPGI